MNLNEAFKLYCSNTPEGTLSTHSKKIREYINIIGDTQIERAFEAELLEKYIYSGDQTAQGKHSALLNFYKYVQISILKRPKRAVNDFPITMEDAKKFDNEHGPYDTARRNNKGDRVFLDKDFKLNTLFMDKYYLHLNNEMASITVKAAIALGLGAGYDSGEMFISNSTPKMKLSDPIIDENVVKVKNYSENSDVSYIEINGMLSDYIRDYYKIRKEHSNVAMDEKDMFFAKLWETRELDFNNNIESSKPYRIQTLVYYMLKYISISNNFESYLTVTDLRSNSVLHSLYNSRGASLKKIIKTFGFTTFVQEAFQRYCEQDKEDSCSILNDDSFFQSSPSDENYTDQENQAADGEVQRLGVLINKIVRDNRIVAKLKQKYNCTCQVCGVPLMLIDDISYAECCHIQPLGGPHKGIDIEENMIILCPNHHKLFDLGFLSIDPDNMDTTVYIDNNNPLHNSKLKLMKHKFSPIFVRYHYENIFLPLRMKIYGY